MAQGCPALEAPLGARLLRLLRPGSPAELCPMLKELRQQPRHGSHRAPVTASPHLSSSADFTPVINSQSSSTPQLNSCLLDRSSSITEGEREMGHFRKDMLLETCPCCGNASERPETQTDFSDFSTFCSLHYFFCKSLTYRKIGQMYFPLLWV